MNYKGILNETEALRKFVKDNYNNSSPILKDGKRYVISLRFYSFQLKTPNIILKLLPSICKDEKTIYFHNLCLLLYLIHTFYDTIYSEENLFGKKKNDIYKFGAYTDHYAILRTKSVLKNDVGLFLESNRDYLLKLVELSNYRPTLDDTNDNWFITNILPLSNECLNFNKNVKDYIIEYNQERQKEQMLKQLLKLKKLNN